MGPRWGVVNTSPLAESAAGVTWIAEESRSTHPTLSTESEQRTLSPEIRVGASSVVLDRDGALWVGTFGDGLRRIAVPSSIEGRSVSRFDPLAEEYTSGNGLSSSFVNAGLMDREGKVLWGTARGLDRFRESAFSPVLTPFSDEPRSILATRDGSLLMSPMNKTVLLRIDSRGGQEQIASHRGSIDSMYRDASGEIWVALI